MRLLEMARLIRRRGTPDEAEVAVIYERQLETDLATRERELTAKSSNQHQLHEVAA